MSAATSFSEPALRALDSMIIVYALLDGHPASNACERFVREREGWFTTPLHLLEIYAVLTKIYGVEAQAANDKLQQILQHALAVVPIDGAMIAGVLETATMFSIDLTDAALIEAVKRLGVQSIATEDQKLQQVCLQMGWTVETPLDDALRQAVSQWEQQHLPAKGLARVLFRVHQWLEKRDETLAHLFWNHTGSGSHLP